jgi:hypothetical protein
MNTYYIVKLLASYHKREHAFECENYGEALNTFKENVIDNAEFLAGLGHGAATISIIDQNNLIVRSFTLTAIKPD